MNKKLLKMEEKRIIAYKGFDENLCCRGFQYEVGKEYEQEGEIVCCAKGFHACTNPFDVLNYYEVNGKNRFCEVEQMGIISADKNDTKQSSSKIRIKAEIGIAGLFKAGVEWIKEKTNPETIVKETKGKGVGSSGDGAQIGSSGYGAKIGSIGDGAKIDSTGEGSVVCCVGNDCTAKASVGSWITLAEWKYSFAKNRFVPVCVKTEFVDGERIKADTWYKLADGEFKEI